MKVLVTGGCGFIGSAVVRHLIRETGHSVINVDKLTYAANVASLEEVHADPRHTFVLADITIRGLMGWVFQEHRPDAVMHLAAESHVDNSISSPTAFINTNVVGTFNLLEAARRHTPHSRFIHISTDEVFGSLGPYEPPFTEESRYSPRSPYSASKAASDHLVSAWHHTYGMPTIVTNATNNYGPWQHSEKLIPLTILKALKGEEIPIYGDGKNYRDWIYVEDHADALVRVLRYGEPGRSYAIGAREPTSNIMLVRLICSYLDYRMPDPAGPRERLIRFVTDRPGHDFRYEINPSRAEVALDWRPRQTFSERLARTIDWYVDKYKC